MEKYGMISELEMARLVAVSRLVMGIVPQAHCTHEPHALSLAAGANLFFPEVGSSPRDGTGDTRQGPGPGHDVLPRHPPGNGLGSGSGLQLFRRSPGCS